MSVALQDDRATVTIDTDNPQLITVKAVGPQGDAGTNGTDGADGADGADGTDGIGVPDPSTATLGQGIVKGAADWEVGDLSAGGSSDPVLAKVPDAAVLANSPSIWYPEEDDANQATLESAGYSAFGDASNPSTFQIIDGALQVDIPAAHASGANRFCGVKIPMVVGSGADFEVVFVVEPNSYLLPPVGGGEGKQVSFFCGVGDTVSDDFWGVYKEAATVALRITGMTNAGVLSTGVGGTLSATPLYFSPNIIRVSRISGTVYYSAMYPSSVGGFEQILRSGAAPWYDFWKQGSSFSQSSAMTHALFGIYHYTAVANRVRLRSIWRAL